MEKTLSPRANALDGVSPEKQILNLAYGHLRVQALATVVQLGVIDLLHGGPKSADEIAEAVKADARVLKRLLNYLSSLNVLAIVEDVKFGLTPLGRTLCSEPTSVLRDNLLLLATPCYWNALGGLLHAAKTGENAFMHTHQLPFFDYLGRSPADSDALNAAMNSSAALGIGAVHGSYDFARYKNVVDVAGGRGSFLTGILRAHSTARGVLFDSETVLKDVTPDARIADRLNVVTGSFFDGVPGGGDLYILNRILHNWSDERAIEILRRCREAIDPEGRLLIIEIAAPPEGQVSEDWSALDMLMLILLDGCERAERDFRRILPTGGFELSRVIRTRSPFWAIEAKPI